jgi:photosystem II stability/assembly factor-like uncharacterized protein
MKRLALVLFSFLFVAAPQVHSQQPNAQPFSELRWRNVGPFRGGRTRAVCGVPSQPNVFYIGAVNGGVWKTTDYGRTWTPIFDDQPTASIGAIAVAPSDPNVIYVGSGEGLHRPDLSVGDGIYKSTDAGKTWTHLGLRDGQQISWISVDPQNANRLFVAVVGHPYGPNAERGIYRSTDGGQTFEKVLYKNENVGGDDVKIDPANPSVVYATLWEAREGPWENGDFNGTEGGIYKSTDGGTTWKELSGGLPTGIVQAYVAISRSNPQRLLAPVATKDTVELYRSDDAGATWTKATDDPRPKMRIGGGDLPVPGIDPKNPDVNYMTSTVTWKSTDGGKTWTGWRGAPGGDDYQNIWINPENPDTIILGSDQGALITVNGGQSWSSWYNQPTAQVYHVNADNAFPYRLCSGQQESGSVCIASRGNDGEITFRDWHPVAAEEYGYVVPDPTDPDIIFGGKLSRYDRRTGQAQNVIPVPLANPNFRVIRTEPIVFSPFDPHMMYFTANTLWTTSDAGRSWKQASPDLTRKTFEVPASVGIFSSQPAAAPKQRGVIYALALSPVDRKRMWAGTDDGLIWVTSDGGAHWDDVTPAQLSPWQKVSVLEASHSDAQEAYAAINTLRLDDLRPHIFRTRDSGKTWTEIVEGIASNQNVNSVREDTQRKGLLFAGTEGGVWLSFDDGGHWRSLRLNLPATSVRDLLVKDNDLAVATHGRGFWILDDITPLRQWDDQLATPMPASHVAPVGKGTLLVSQPALRVRWNTNSDTPLPPDVAAGQNPPDGAILNYYLKSAVAGPVTLEIEDSDGKPVGRFSSADPVERPDPKLEIPQYWVRPPQRVSSEAGLHRFVWDLHYAPVPGIKPEYPIAAVAENTAPQPTSPWVQPGQYRVVLTVGGEKSTQPLTVTMDPRVKTPTADLQKQFELSWLMYQDLLRLQPIVDRAAAAADRLAEQLKTASGEDRQRLEALSKQIDELKGQEGRRRRGPHQNTLTGVRGSVMQLFTMLQETDQAPTTQVADQVPKVHQQAASIIREWTAFENARLATPK